jgi:hypothetical protein
MRDFEIECRMDTAVAGTAEGLVGSTAAVAVEGMIAAGADYMPQQ